jgi:hypothetical protein
VSLSLSCSFAVMPWENTVQRPFVRCEHLGVGLPSLRTVRSKFFLFIDYSTCSILVYSNIKCTEAAGKELVQRIRGSRVSHKEG